jgi:hypothetical protein
LNALASSPSASLAAARSAPSTIVRTDGTHADTFSVRQIAGVPSTRSA